MLAPSLSRAVTIFLELGVMLMLGSCSLTSKSSAKDLDYEADICTISLAFKSPFVKAFQTVQSSRVLICNHSSPVLPMSPSSSSSSSPTRKREIHAVYVQVPSNTNQSLGKHQRTSHVVLNIISSNKNAVRNMEYVFVLASNQSVTWKIVPDYLHRLRHSQFWISSNSQLSPNAVLLKPKKFKTPSSVQSLSHWAAEKFDIITTLKEHVLTRKFTESISLAVGGAFECGELDKEETPAETSGCIIPANQALGDIDVHIIELEKHDSASSAVILDIRAESKVLLRKHLLLVLKSHQPTRWVVRTWKLRGTLDIITDQSVDTNSIVMQSVRVVNEHLSSLNSSNLIAWTASNYGAPTSYTAAKVASRFDMTIDAMDGKWQQGKDEDGNDFNSDGLSWKLLDQIRTAAERSRFLTCLGGGMEISLHKNLLSDFKLSSDQLSLDDPACVAQENATHFFWVTTSLNACGGIERHLHNRIRVDNAVIIRPLKSTTGIQSTDDFSGSGMKPTAVGDDGVYETLSDDEDISYAPLTVIRLDFNCSYSLEKELPMDVDYYLRLYRDVLYQHEIISFPVVANSNQSLFLEAGIHTDQRIQTMIHNCNVFPAEKPELFHPLIAKGCIVDNTVVWKEDEYFVDSATVERFEFRIQKWWNDHSKVGLQCDLTVCSRLSSDRTGLAQCQARDRLCHQHITADQMVLLKQNMVTKKTGPLVLHSFVNNSSTSGLISQADSKGASEEEQPLKEENTLCNQIVRIEGLDSPTVIGIAFSAFVIGTLLSGALWYIHSHTGGSKVPMKKRSSRQRFAETSGESTPSSTAPITICQTINQV